MVKNVSPPTHDIMLLQLLINPSWFDYLGEKENKHCVI